MRCMHCTRDVPDGMFCTWCGRQQVANAPRYAHFAAHPSEHVFHPGVLTTLFPHLAHHKIHEFRWTLLAGVACIALLDVAGLVAAALLCAAFLVPVLYLMYLYEAQVYKDEPAPVLGFTIGTGVVLGIVVTILVKATTGPIALRSLYGSDTAALLTLGLIVPVGQELLKPLPALVLRMRGGFSEQMDGLVFGVAAGLGFSVAETIVRFSAVLTNVPAHTDPANWIYPLTTVALLLPLLHGSATGAITAALWQVRSRRFGPREALVIALAVVAHIGFILVSQILSDRGFAQLVILAWQAVVIGALLVGIRYMLHEALLTETIDLGFNQTICPNCHHQVVAARFCPRCGKVLAVVRAPRVAKAPAPEVEVR